MLNQFMQSGLFFWFAQTFNNAYTWELAPSISSILQCVVQLAGSCTGMFLLMQWCERICGNGESVPSRLRMVIFHLRASCFGAFFGFVACLFFYIKTFAQFGSLLTLSHDYSGTLTAEQRTECSKGGGTIDFLLVFIFICIAAVMAMTVGSDGHMSNISLGSVSLDLQEFASGPQQAIKQTGDMLARFLVGNCYMGVISALWKMDKAGQQQAPAGLNKTDPVYQRWVDDMACMTGAADARKLYYGYALMMLTFALIPLFYWRASMPLKAGVVNIQVKAQKAIQEALAMETGDKAPSMQQKLDAVDKAIAGAKKAELQKNEKLGGANLVAHINQVRGHLERDLSLVAAGKKVKVVTQTSKVEEIDMPDDTAVVSPDSEIERLKAENAGLLAEVRRLEPFENEAAQLRDALAKLKKELTSEGASSVRTMTI
jgi:hypothetical protein